MHAEGWDCETIGTEAVYVDKYVQRMETETVGTV